MNAHTHFRFRARVTWLIVLLWLSIFAVTYLAINLMRAPNVARATVGDAAGGEIVIPKSRDGHYYVAGSINATAVTFLVDTGASVVAVGPGIAEAANLPEGIAARLDTAGGPVIGNMVRGATVVAGGIRVGDLRVAVLPTMAGERALVGQNFLRYVAIEQRGDDLILRLRWKPG